MNAQHLRFAARPARLLGALLVMAGTIAGLAREAAASDAHAGETPAGMHRPSLDPFMTLLTPRALSVDDRRMTPLPPPPLPPAPVVQPVQFDVSAIGTEAGQSIALLEFSGGSYIVRQGDKVPADSETPAFVVKAIHDHRVEVFDFKTQLPVARDLPVE